MKLILFFMLYLCVALQADSSIEYKISYFPDESKNISIDKVQEKTFFPTDNGVQNFGITRTPYWFKLDFSPKKEQLSQNWWIKIDYPPLDYIDIYLLDKESNIIKTVTSGELQSFANREVKDPAFIYLLPLEKAQDYTLYIRVQTEGALQVPISLLSSSSILEQQYMPLIISGIYYGIFIIIFLYNGVIFLYTRDNNYLYYLLFVNTFIFWQLSLDGIGIAYIWGDYPWIVEHASILGTPAVTFAAILFSRKFLSTNIYLPTIDIYLKYFMYFCLLVTASAFVAPYHYVVQVDGLLSIFAPIALFTSGVLVLKKGYRPARFYIIGWFVFLVGCILFALNKFNLIGGFYFMNHAQQIGSAVEMLMLSWALGDRIKSIQDQYLEKTRGMNAVLQQRIDSALEKERQKDKIMIEQSRFAALGEMIEQIAHQWRQPLNTLSLINQNLYFKYKLHEFDPSLFEEAHSKIDENLQYMSKTIDDFRNFYTNTQEKQRYSVREVVNSALSLSEATITYARIKVIIDSVDECYVYNIKNELVQICMNILKNAHDALVEKRKKDREIHINIYSSNNEVFICIKDNAGGLPEEVMPNIFNPYFTTKDRELGTGIGLYMSKSIVEEHMNGRIIVENVKDGAQFTIILPQA